MSKRVTYSLLAYNFFLALFLRYSSSIGIENGSPDSWDYHLQINQIVKEGLVSWIFHPLSYYGLYPPNMEAGIEIFTVSISLMTNFSVMHSILITSIFLGVFSIFISFLVSKEFFGNNFISVICAIIFSCSPLVYQSTVWGINRRLFVSILVLISLFFMIKTYKSENRTRSTLLFVISILAVSSVHKSSIFYMLIILIFLFSLLIYKYFPSLFLKNTERSKNIFYYSFISVIIFMILFGTFINNTILNVQTFLYTLYKTGFNISMDLGILTPFAIIGLLYFRHKRINAIRLFFIILLISGIFIHFVIPQPRGLIREPVSFYIFHFLYFFVIAIGIWHATVFSRRRFAFPFVVLFITIASIVPEYAVVNPIEEGDSEEYYFNMLSSGNYVEHGLMLEENSQIIGYGVQMDRVMSFGEGKYYYPPLITAINVSNYEFNLFIFFESQKAEGFVKEEGLRYEQVVSENYIEKSINSDRVRLDFIYYKIDYVFIGGSYLNNPNHNLVYDIQMNCYKSYEDNNGELYEINMQ